MKKIRINELARELEVKPNKILELLPDLGVQERKTHSSSIDEDVAIIVKQRLVEEGVARADARIGGSDGDHDPGDYEVEEDDHEFVAEPERIVLAPALHPTAPIETPSATISVSKAAPAAEPPARADVQPARVETPPAPQPQPAPRVPPAAHSPVAPQAPHVAPQPPLGQPEGQRHAQPPVHSPAPEEPVRPKASMPLRPPLFPASGHREPIHPPMHRPSGLTPPAMPMPPSTPRPVPSSPQPPTQAHSPASSPQLGPSQTTPIQPGPGQPSPSHPSPGQAGLSQPRAVSQAAPSQPSVNQPGVSQLGVSQPPPPPRTTLPTPASPGPGSASDSLPPGAPMPGVSAPSASLRPVPNTPIYRPGQVLSGPRQPLPPGVTPPPPVPVETRSAGPGQPRPAAPSAPLRPSGPRAPAPGGIAIPRSNPPSPSPQPPPSSVPGGPQSRPAFAGQPTARPVVPPRADLAARLAQGKPMPGAAAPPMPRPGLPTRPAGSPVPGQPIYRGPIRPGQPMMRGPGVPAGAGAPNRGIRPQRPMHPTSPMRIEPSAPPPADTQRRGQFKPGGGRPGDRRTRDVEGKMFRAPVSRREQPVAPPPIDREITIGEGITVKELSEKLAVKANAIIKKLVEKKVFATINQTLDLKMAEDIARDFGAATAHMSYEEEASFEVELAEESKDLVRRAPVVTIMGHVDHGKTSLLDAIRQTNVAGREAGGITQHIGAYQIKKGDRKIVFIDTPGHAAFTRMRARGAKVTDIVVLVVSADDGVMPQTLEAIDHAKAAKVPIVVAINKVDKPDAQPERIKQQLADRGLLAEDWGGDVVMVPVSAKTKQNLDLLLEMILLVADIGNYKANLTRSAIGTVLEAELDKGRGPVPTVLVQNGTLRVGDFFICGQVFGKVRAMFSDVGENIREAEPSTPVQVLGLDAMPEVGDSFQVVTDTAKAKQIVVYRESKARERSMSKGARVTLEQFHEQVKEGDSKELNIIIKADVSGTAEVLTEMLQKLSNEKVKIRVLHKNVGAITETDVLLGSASSAIIIGFNVKPDRAAAALAEKEKVDIRQHSIIYELNDEIKKYMSGMLDPVFKEVFRGRAVVQEVFKITKVGTVAGCLVTEGTITRDSLVRVFRAKVVVHTGKVESLKRFKDDAKEAKAGMECGITIANYSDLRAADEIEAFVSERVATEMF